MTRTLAGRALTETGFLAPFRLECALFQDRDSGRCSIPTAPPYGGAVEVLVRRAGCISANHRRNFGVPGSGTAGGTAAGYQSRLPAGSVIPQRAEAARNHGAA